MADEIRALLQKAAATGRRVDGYFGGAGGAYFGAATPIGSRHEPRFRVEWLGPSESQGVIFFDVNLRPMSERTHAVA